ncbi:MAG: cation:proton antiporter [Planctomycetota bacterium]
MPEAPAFLKDLALVLCVAAVTTVVSRWLNQPAILGYLLAGLVLGPHVPVPLFADPDRIHALSELGVVLVMFGIGLEFSVRRLARVVPAAGLVGGVQVGLMLWLGYVAAAGLGWGERERLFAGAAVAVSSTMMVAKVFAERRMPRKLSDLVYGVLVVEDLAAVLLLAVLTAVAPGSHVSPETLAGTVGRLAGFLLGLAVAGYLVVPRALGAVARLGSSETLLVASVGACFALAIAAREAGYSVALGAFLAGALSAESGAGRRISEVTRPLRDVFAAVFFVSVGMGIDPLIIARHGGATALFAAVVLFGQTVSVSLGGLLAGNDVRTSVQAGLSLAQIGEFSFLIAGLGVMSGAARPELYAIVVAVSVITAFATPRLVGVSDAIALGLERRLPRPVQTLVSLYGAWLEQFRLSGRSGAGVSRARRLIRLVVVDAVLLAAVVIGAAVINDWAVARLTDAGLPPLVARWLMAATAVAAATPFGIGLARESRAIGMELAVRVLPSAGQGALDRAAAPRRAFVVTLQLGVVLAVGAPLLVVTQPFVPLPWGPAILLLVLTVLGTVFWRRVADLQGHVRAGAQVVIEALARQAPGPGPALRTAERLLPGLGPLASVRVRPGSPAVSKTLAEINLRALTGANAIAISQAGEPVITPTGREELRAGDVLALAGTHDAIAAARGLLSGWEPDADEEEEGEH